MIPAHKIKRILTMGLISFGMGPVPVSKVFQGKGMMMLVMVIVVVMMVVMMMMMDLYE